MDVVIGILETKVTVAMVVGWWLGGFIVRVAVGTYERMRRY